MIVVHRTLSSSLVPRTNSHFFIFLSFVSSSGFREWLQSNLALWGTDWFGGWEERQQTGGRIDGCVFVFLFCVFLLTGVDRVGFGVGCCWAFAGAGAILLSFSFDGIGRAALSGSTLEG